MASWTLFIILWMSDGGVSVVESLQFTREGSCKSAALYATSKPIEGVKKINAICKKTTKV
jgi:hypothetical protein